MADRSQRSTGNRRAVCNALFRSMMDRRKLRESDLRPSRTILGPPRADDPPDKRRSVSPNPADDPTFCRETISIDGGPEMNAYHIISPDYLAACRVLATPTPPHPLLRWWRRLLWGE